MISPLCSLPHTLSKSAFASSSKQIFCNRELTLSKIDAVGFDMDFTLVKYTQAFDELAYQGTKKKLLNMGYPSEVASLEYCPHRFTRGLILDKERGNILKLDRHDYVNIAQHGSKVLTREQRHHTYRDQVDVRPSFGDENYLNLDTQFHLVDAALFEQLVDMKDSVPETESFLNNKSYADLAQDIRTCVDVCHKDGVIKNAVMSSPELFIESDASIFAMLAKLQAAKKKVFLLTNSLYDYSNAVMSYLFQQFRVLNPTSSSAQDHKTWKDFFDVIMVGAGKPDFVKQRGEKMIFRVLNHNNTTQYLLQNCEDIYSLPSESKDEKFIRMNNILEKGKVFQGGNWKHLHELLGIDAGEKLLYVGDHMYSDIVKGKRKLGWRTCLLIPELEDTLGRAEHASEIWDQVKTLRTRQSDLDEQVDRISSELYLRDVSGVSKENIICGPLIDQRRELAKQQAEVQQQLGDALALYHRQFNPNWGHMFKAKLVGSRFAKQVSDYACIYTANANSVGSVSMKRAFTPSLDEMPHDVASS